MTPNSKRRRDAAGPSATADIETRDGARAETVGSRERNRAVSDLVGFVLVFAVIISSVALVATFGFGALSDFRTAEQQNNAERAFVLLSQGFNDVRDGHAPKRDSVISVENADVAIRNVSTVSFEVFDGGGSSILDVTRPAGAITYRQDDTEIAYELGGLMRRDGGSAVMQASPAFRCEDDRATVSYVQLTSPGSRQFRGGTVDVTGRHRRSRTIYPTSRSGAGGPTDGARLEVTIDSRFSDGWNDFFTRDDNGWTHVSGDTYACDADRIRVHETVIAVEMSG